MDGQERPDYLSDIWSLCTTLSSEALDAAANKAKANGFKLDRGDVTFTEVVINLASAREVLKDAIDKKKLIQLPISVQKELLSNLQAISKALQGTMNNADEIVNLGNAVELLNTSIWKYGLHNLSDQVLGYQTKLNELKQQEVQAKKLFATLESIVVTSDNLATLAEQAGQDMAQIEKSKLTIEQEAAAASTARQQAQEEATKASNATNIATQVEAQMAQYLSTAKAAVVDITPLETSIKGFFAEIDSYRRQIAASTDESSKFLADSNAAVGKSVSDANTKVTAEIDRLNAAATSVSAAQALALTTQIEHNGTAFAKFISDIGKRENARIKDATDAATAQLTRDQEEHSAFVLAAQEKLDGLESGLKARAEETIEKNREDVAVLMRELATLKESVQEQVTQATGLGQFGAFQSRMNTISAGKYWWAMAVGGLVLIVITLTYFIALHAQQGDLHSAAFWIKLSMNVPLGFLISFCTIQYSRERRLEEEYAFKASISVSLNPYRDLIYSILERDGTLADGTYTKFVVDSVRNVFTSPTEKIFDSPKKFEGVSEKSLKATAELIGTAVKAAK
jgi:hypothetical protein